MTDDEIEAEARLVRQAERAIMPKRLHRVTAALQVVTYIDGVTAALQVVT
jgi:hypothetical protein